MEPFLLGLRQKIENAAVHPGHNEALRSNIQEAYCYIRNRAPSGGGNRAELCALEELCRQKMLEMDLAAAQVSSRPPMSPVDIEYALAEFCDAFDIAAGAGGRRVNYHGSGDGQILVCCPDLVLKGTGFLIRLLMLAGFRAVNVYTRFTADYFLIRLHGSFGHPCTDSPIRSPELAAARAIPLRHSGALIGLLLGEKTDPIFCYPLALRSDAAPAHIPEFCDYLCSRLSTVYTCLYGL
ncbi:MAG: hypothetical protein ACLU8W_01595 [Clostridia bacterium]